VSEFPRKDENGNMVWACCVSSIGPECGHKTVETRYAVATYSYACTAYVRTTLRRALALQPTDNVWAGTEYVNTARGMVGHTGWATETLPDEQTWSLTKHELMTIRRALEWREGKSAYLSNSQLLRDEWSNITNEINRVCREIWHSEGKYWV
jgi:hypothetical protein